VGAAIGVTGVALLVLRGEVSADAVGVLASLGAVGLSSLGFVLAKRWAPPVDMVTFSAWQLVAGGLVLVPLAALVEGAPPTLDARAVGGFLYICIFGTAVANVAWFTGLRRMPAGAVSLVGLLNPLVGVGLGVAIAGEAFGAVQALGILLVLGGVLLGQPAVQDMVLARVRTARPLVLDGPGAPLDEPGRRVPAA
jgi:probable blue pigment (indigoidine) exporter